MTSSGSDNSSTSSSKNNKSSVCTFTLFTNYEKITLVADTEKEKQMWINVIQFNKDQEDNPSPTTNASPLVTTTPGMTPYGIKCSENLYELFSDSFIFIVIFVF